MLGSIEMSKLNGIWIIKNLIRRFLLADEPNIKNKGSKNEVCCLMIVTTIKVKAISP